MAFWLRAKKRTPILAEDDVRVSPAISPDTSAPLAAASPPHITSGVGPDALMTPSWDEVSRAVIVWTGFDRSVELGMPGRDEVGLVKSFGEKAAGALLPILEQLQADFYRSTAHNTVSGSREMAEQAADEFRVLHPELSDDAVAAFAWCYSFDWK